MPQLPGKQESLLTVLDGIVSLNEVKSKVQSIAPSSPNQYLNGLSVLLSEVVSDGCAWVRHLSRQHLRGPNDQNYCYASHPFALYTQINCTVEEGFTCNYQGLTDLRNKLRAYEALDRTAFSLKEYLYLANSATN